MLPVKACGDVVKDEWKPVSAPGASPFYALVGDSLSASELGADDYLTKPFSVEELLARIRAVIRRAQVTSNDSGYALQSTMTIGPLTIDDARHEVRMAGREIVLATLEYRLLFYLAQNAGRVVTQEQLLLSRQGI